MDAKLVAQIVQEAREAAAKATAESLNKHGHGLCGFAWITVPIKGSTKVGRALLKNGFSKAYGGGLQLWNPSQSYTQCVEAKEAGARAAATVLCRYGIEAYAGSRLD